MFQFCLAKLTAKAKKTESGVGLNAFARGQTPKKKLQSTNMIYRLGTQNDLDEISQLIKKAIIEMENQDIHQWDDLYPTREDFQQDISNNTLYVAQMDKTIAALYVVSQECDEAYKAIKWENDDKKACILHRLCVSPDFQHQGIGTELLKHIEAQLFSEGFASIRLDVFTQNPFALKLYRNNGYQERGFADWRKGRFILMEKQLK